MFPDFYYLIPIQYIKHPVLNSLYHLFSLMKLFPKFLHLTLQSAISTIPPPRHEFL